jgi:CBS domain-containing protein
MQFARLRYSELPLPSKNQLVLMNKSNIVISMTGNFASLLEEASSIDQEKDADKCDSTFCHGAYTLLSDKRYIRTIMRHLANTLAPDESDHSGLHQAHDLCVDETSHFGGYRQNSHDASGICADAKIADADVSLRATSISDLVHQIERSRCVKEVAEHRKTLPCIVRKMMIGGADTRSLTSKISAVSDAIFRKVVALTLEKIGPPPTPYVLMAMGSEGRSEQTLTTDQDNAILYKDVFSERSKVRSYFLKFGEMVCNLLNESGFDYCAGGVMAKNPIWCQPLSVWKHYFSQWIHTADAKNLLQASIFFDFRGVCGDLRLSEELHKHLFGALGVWPGFFQHLAENALYFSPPLGSLRTFRIRSKGTHPSAFDIKSALMPIVDIVRVYALKHGVESKNTWDRIQDLAVKKVLSRQDSEELEKAYNTLMELRLMRQLDAIIEEKSKPDNIINLTKLTKIERATIKEIFKQEKKYQNMMRSTFIGAY